MEGIAVQARSAAARPRREARGPSPAIMSIKNLKADDLEIEALAGESEAGAALRLVLRGAIHSPTPEDFLAPYFEEAVEFARSNDQRLICDFTALDYMNSASIPPLIQLLRSLAEMGVHGEFIYDSSRKVQTASFRALDVIAKKSKFTVVRGA